MKPVSDVLFTDFVAQNRFFTHSKDPTCRAVLHRSVCWPLPLLIPKTVPSTLRVASSRSPTGQTTGSDGALSNRKRHRVADGAQP